jgi:hypothetical protein
MLAVQRPCWDRELAYYLLPQGVLHGRCTASIYTTVEAALESYTFSPFHYIAT